eukprot:TRINITY_DN3523_c0_g1_i5.p1 TRINITY_DN3523_c0_g1~~TRINITY_DN3523_c0_g1_i5.p1  ORF type:complete len:415 (+),score=117.56 TRINITY_DN3523_c0_g1_i5:261-1505(+)
MSARIVFGATDYVCTQVVSVTCCGCVWAPGRVGRFRLTEAIHSRGINARYLGRIRAEIADADFRAIILVDIVARVIKNNLRTRLRAKMKQLKKPMEEPYRRLVVNYMNLIFGHTGQSDSYWSGTIRDDITRNFTQALTPLELSVALFKPRRVAADAGHDQQASPLDTNFLLLLLQRFVKMTGIAFSSRIMNEALFSMPQPFTDTDLETLPLTIKHLNVINFAEGFFLHMRGLEWRLTDPQLAERFYRNAIEKFHKALDSNPNNKEVLQGVALTWTFLLEDQYARVICEGGYFPKSDEKVIEATEYYLRSIYAPPKYDSQSLFLYAYFLERLGQFDSAEDYYLQSLEADPNNAACLLQYGNFLVERGQAHYAERMWLRGSATTADTDWNYWGMGKTAWDRSNSKSTSRSRLAQQR